ncbi:unnamed protein product [Caenorhabditis angaria]|uniref:Serpentine receptor class gamma n=1 Tax=Caenorhabditis angaria TaxID=860376 RepID=A0A9P1IWW5_9PELO|nr:unnamed protein product [Caenorhabditis angaria]
MLLIMLISIILTYISQFYFECCPVIYDPNISSIAYPNINPNVINKSNKFIDIPLNFTSTTITTFCYLMILIKFMKTKNKVGDQSGIMNASKKKDLL